MEKHQFLWTLGIAFPVVVGGSYLSLELLLLFALLLLLPWAIRFVSSPDHGNVPFYQGAAQFFLWSHLGGCLITANPTFSMGKILLDLLGLGFFGGLANYRKREAEVVRILLYTYLSITILTLAVPFLTSWPLYTKLFYYGYFRSLYDLTLNFPWKVNWYINPNVLSGLVVLFLPYAMSVFLYAGTKTEALKSRIPGGKGVLALSILGSLIAVIFFQSRSSLFALALSLFLWLCLLRKKVWIYLLIALILFAILAGVSGEIRECLIHLSGQKMDETLEVRMELWKRALAMIGEYPCTGIGMGMYAWVSQHIFSFYEINDSIPGASITHAHQLYLQIPVDIGLPGLLAWSSLLGYLFLLPKNKEGKFYLLQYGIKCGLAVMMINGLTDCPLWGTRVAPFAWLIMGGLIVLSEDGQRKNSLRWRTILFIWSGIFLLSLFLVKIHVLSAVLLTCGGGLLLGMEQSTGILQENIRRWFGRRIH